MDFVLETLVTAVALSLDALAVAVAAGLASGGAKPRDALRIAACFGGFQAGMPLLGALLGAGVAPFVERSAPMLAGAVLIALGLFAVRKAIVDPEHDAEVAFLDTRVLLALGVATSLDAFAVGVSFSLASEPVVASAAIIGVVTFVLCALGALIAERVERWIGSRAEIAGGIALVLVGLRMLARALFAI